MNTELKNQYGKRLLLWIVLGYGICMLALIGMLIGQMVMNSNVLYSGSLWMTVIDIAITLVDILAYTFAAAAILYGIYLSGIKGLANMPAAYLCLTVLHYVTVMCVGWGLFGLPETVNELFGQLWSDMLLFVLLDCLRVFLIAFFFTRAIEKHEKKRALHNRAAAMVGNELQGSRHGIFPLRTLLSFKNPIQLGAFVAALIYWLTFIIQYIYIDILSLISFGRVEEFVMQFVYVLLNAILAAICYCIINYMLMKMDEKMPKTDE